MFAEEFRLDISQIPVFDSPSRGLQPGDPTAPPGPAADDAEPTKILAVSLEAETAEVQPHRSYAYSVRIRNVNERPVRIPWTRDSELLKLTAGVRLCLDMSISVVHPSGRFDVLTYATLYGNSLLPESVRVLRKGDVAIIVAPMAVDPDQIPNGDRMIPGIWELAARVAFILGAPDRFHGRMKTGAIKVKVLASR